jgi:hypothetical protein
MLAKRRGLPQLLGKPSIGWMTGNTDMHDAPRMMFDNEKGIELPKGSIDRWKEITGPKLGGVSIQKRCPRLPNGP